MEQTSREHAPGGAHELNDTTEQHPLIWADHDTLPTEGRWLYVVDKAAWDRGEVKGAWVPADLDAHQTAMAVGSIVGQPMARADLTVVDQVGIDEMVDEDHFTPPRWPW